MTDLDDAIAALTAEGEEIDHMVAGLTPSEWATPTPAPGWDVAHQISHLATIFRVAGAAASDMEAFKAMTATLQDDFNAGLRAQESVYLADPPETQLMHWRAEFHAAVKALATVPPNQLVPWLVNPLPPTVLAAAGMMELFAHGQDVADALGIRRVRTDRIGYLVTFGVRTKDFGYLARGQKPPEGEWRFELTAPSGKRWDFGPVDAPQKITGPGVDFCLLVSRRRHHKDLAIVATGADAEQWLEIAQAYRGPAGAGRTPGQFPSDHG